MLFQSRLRRYKSKFPENTLASFQGALEAGADIIETDIQVSGDGVVVISHDPNTIRCFGVNHEITKTPYHGVLDQLETVKEPKSKMPILEDVARLFAENPAYSKARLMIDVKRTNEPWVIDKVRNVLVSINPDIEGFWASKVILGIWRMDVLTQAENVLPQLQVIHIGVSRSTARQFLERPQVASISLIHLSLSTIRGKNLIDYAKALGKGVYSWTINSEQAMKWAIASDLDGIITDDPAKYSKLIDNLSDEEIIHDYANVSPASFIPLKQRVSNELLFMLLRFLVKIFLLKEYFTPVRKYVD